MKKRIRSIVIALMCVMISGCGTTDNGTQEADYHEIVEAVSETSEIEAAAEQIHTQEETAAVEEEKEEPDTADSTFSIADIPEYSGSPYAVVNDNTPYFSDSDLIGQSFEEYAELDSLGRCGVCVASIGPDIMPTEERGEIGSVHPTGWHTVKYPGIVDGNYLYNRCHLIGYQLTGENANEKNLITGTRYMNVEGMLPFENMIADYVKETGNHVMYRVTPIFEEENLLATGVLMEAESVEDKGKGILFNVFCYNGQTGITIDYATGESTESDTAMEEEAAPAAVEENTSIQQETTGAYAVNPNNGKIHIVGACPATGNGDNAMSNPVYFDTYEEALAYSEQIAPSQEKRQCGNCW